MVKCGRRESNPQGEMPVGSNPTAFTSFATSAKGKPSGGRTGQSNRSASSFQLTGGGNRTTMRTMPAGIRSYTANLLGRRTNMSPGRLSFPNDLPAGASCLLSLVEAVAYDSVDVLTRYAAFQVGGVDNPPDLTPFEPSGLDHFVYRGRPFPYDGENMVSDRRSPSMPSPARSVRDAVASQRHFVQVCPDGFEGPDGIVVLGVNALAKLVNQISHGLFPNEIATLNIAT